MPGKSNQPALQKEEKHNDIQRDLNGETYLANQSASAPLQERRKNMRILTENIPGKSNQLRPRGKEEKHDIHKGILAENISGKSNQPSPRGKEEKNMIYTKGSWKTYLLRPRWKGGTHDIHKGILTENIPGKSNQLRALDGKGGTHDIHKGILTENIPGNPISYARWKGRTHHIHKGILAEGKTYTKKSNQLALDEGGTHDMQRDLGKHAWKSNQLPLDGKEEHMIYFQRILTENIPGKSQDLNGKHAWKSNQPHSALDGKGGTHHIHKGSYGENIPGNPISYALDGKETPSYTQRDLGENIRKSNQLRPDGKGGTHHIHKGILGKHAWEIQSATAP
ncbi:unnamed protein product [Mytilus edulis]|uniref:Uncharacterized protein n=1 Tax=Mytilus edulis TaxID=6550 RepID=A0A8S3V2L8_MYTED|nr:unnamed protein product [Mytilus edulis]